MILDHIRSVLLGLGYICTPAIGDRISTAGKLCIKSIGGVVSQKQIWNLFMGIKDGCKVTVISLRSCPKTPYFFYFTRIVFTLIPSLLLISCVISQNPFPHWQKWGYDIY